MARIRRYLTAGGTLACALGIAYFMQSSAGDSRATAQAPLAPPAEITRVELTSAPALPAVPPAATATLPTAPVIRVVARDLPLPETFPAEESVPGFTCEAVMKAAVLDDAMVRLDIEAPCRPDARYTLHHAGMMASALLDGAGHGRVTVPALAEAAVFIVSFEDGTGAVATAQVPDLSAQERFVVQWNGDAESLHLHALENGADFGEPGHVWSGAEAPQGEGTLVRLGDGVPAPAFRAEIYSFPRGGAAQGSDVTLRLEAEVTLANCGRDLEAQSLAIGATGAPVLRDVILPMPDCAAQGEFLVLKNLFDDLMIAQK